MQTLTFTKPNALSKLHDELIAAVTGFLRTTAGPDGRDAADDACGRVEGKDDDFTVYFADDIDAATVTSVVDAHVP